MTEFIKECEGIYRLKVQYTTVYTSIFLIETERGDLLVDTASYDDDINNVLVPALAKMNKSLEGLYAIVITHDHFDHSGGLKRIREIVPDVRVITELCNLTDNISTYPMAGHTEDCIGVLDTRSGTLISGDGLQGAGVDKYRCSVRKREAYLETIERIKNDGRIENILFSHAYEPWDRDSVIGRREVDACLSECIKYINGGKNESNTCK
jgi:glyoxylase-like metal-dependent hydrolase (beta-lactamase superfamily II)